MQCTGNSGCFFWEKRAAIVRRFFSFFLCAVFFAFPYHRLWGLLFSTDGYGIFNVRTNLGVCAVHTKGDQAQTSLHKSWLGGTFFFGGGIEPRVYGFEFWLSNQHWAMSSFIEFGCRAWCLTAIGSVDGKQIETMLLSNQIRSALLIHTINIILLGPHKWRHLPVYVYHLSLPCFPFFLLILIVLSLLLVVQKCSYQPESRCLWWCVLCGGACDEALLCSCWYCVFSCGGHVK